MRCYWLVLAILLSGMAQAELFNPEKRLWTPVEDKVFLQEISQKIPTDHPVKSIAHFKDDIFFVMEGQIYKHRQQSYSLLPSSPSDVKRLLNMDNILWALSDTGLYRWNGQTWQKSLDQDIVDMCLHNGAIHAASREAIFRLQANKWIDIKPEGGYHSSDVTVTMADGSQVLSDPVRLGPVHRIDSYSGTLYVLRPGKIVLLDGPVVEQDGIDWGTLPSPNTFDMQALGSRLFVSTDRGLGVLRGAALKTIKGTDGLPYEETTCLARGFDNDLWIGTTTGAVRMLEDDWHYFGPYRWLPENFVHDISVVNKSVAIATDGGIGIITYEPYTLAKKADYYEQHIESWGHRRLGFIHTLYWNNEHDQWVREISDNDGGHTAPYLAAMCYKYAVTEDEKDYQKAVDSFKAMVWLEQITPKKGFFARAIWSTSGDLDTRSRHGSGGLPAKWYPTKDGKWYWKGDTSSDEVDAHFYSVSLFHDLVAKGKDKELAKQHLTRIAEHIIENDWVLRDMDGQPTRWGRWDPEYLLRPYGFVARGLNGMQAQTYMHTAYALSGEEKFQQGLQQTLDWGYHRYTVRQKLTFPPEDIAPWDDNLANRCYYTLMRYADDPYLTSIYLRSLERTYALKRIEHIPWYNFTYGAITGNDCEADKAAQHLRSWPLDCIDYSYRNSHRDDLHPEPGYIPYTGGSKAIPPRETSILRGHRNALYLDGGAGGRRVMEPTGYLRDYWMGRYHGFISAPETTDKALLSVPAQDIDPQGAKSYKGPQRPEIDLQ